MATKTKGRSTPKVKLDAKVLLAVVVCLALSVSMYFMFTKPQRIEAAALASQARTAELELQHNNQRISDISTGRTTAADEVLKSAQDLDRKLPADVDKVSLVASIPNLAAQYHVTVNQMDPTVTPDAATAGNLKNQSFTVAAAGTTEAVAGWISALQSYPSIVTISGLALNMTSASEATATFTLKAFYVPTAVLPKS